MQAWYGRRPALPPWRTASVTSRRIFAVFQCTVGGSAPACAAWEGLVRDQRTHMSVMGHILGHIELRESHYKHIGVL